MKQRTQTARSNGRPRDNGVGESRGPSSARALERRREATEQRVRWIQENSPWRQWAVIGLLGTGLGTILSWEVLLVLAARNDWIIRINANQFNEGIVKLVVMTALIPTYTWALIEVIRTRFKR